MRFRKIQFNNYRCFIDETVEFEEYGKNNVNVLIGPNGGGKTELLFSFWWTLYDFDFSKLVGKEDTPYALNSKLYRSIENGKVGDTQTCSVTIELENEGKVYVITKRCDYRKTEKKVTVNEYQELSYYKDNMELSLPLRDPDEIEKQLSRIIPRSILYGIIFDGERMQKLSTRDENSKTAIKGVISDITNVELLEKCSEHFKSVKKSINKELKSYSKKVGNESIDEILDDISKKEKRYDELEKLISDDEALLESTIITQSSIAEQLKENAVAKEIEIKRQAEIAQRDKAIERLDDYYKNFAASLKDAYLLVSTDLLDDVDEVIQSYDVPEDLTVNAVKSILKRENCICGRHIDDEARKTLIELIDALPPDNINSTLSEIIRQTKQRIDDVTSQTTQNYKLISDCQSEITTCKDNIAHYSTELSTMSDGIEAQKAAELEKQNIELNQTIGKLKERIPQNKKEYQSLEKALEDLKDKRDAKTNYEGISKKFNDQLKFVEKCLVALEHIRSVNKMSALTVINDKLSEAFKLLSEDADRGRNIRIIQYDESHMYQIAAYLEVTVQNKLSIWKDDGTYSKYDNLGLEADEIYEKAILESMDANSTGQGKMNTFSFVKAILDYSNQKKSSDGIEITKEYPLLIDAPFGDISGDNLTKSSSELHGFAHQVILMIDKDRYKELEKNFAPYVSKKYYFKKQKNENRSTISES